MTKKAPLPFFPIAYDVEEGKTYYWCSCGKSKTQPLCDHPMDCGDKAVPYDATLTETVYFCGCKKTNDPPLCDGSHAKVLMEYLKEKK
ncbi:MULTISPECIES: CDGSH iron-sulfur domain-containing protein [Legionella]|uniref:Glutamate synthetase n=1 Tax=Legionella maceachernii TaxID=466 RepID=A0A0W0WCV8_9GAMM|nr:CDGSH iron-sulfur domain-containing protein [Legionella maceachernii]KTD30186.1 glutamate synthetase [Legionella maceachernii]SJZ92710.1 Iron-binding zinc finger CDGSH type [Legionella maceachernii]SUP03505.1 Uncharacterized conserved protein [Legionella maceachernii]